MATGLSLEIDLSDYNKTVNALASVMKPQQFENAMAGIFRRTGNRVKKILRDELPKEYRIPKPEVGRAVKGAKTTVSGSGVGCVIPVVDSRRKLGGRASDRTFGSTGSAAGTVTFPRKNGGKGVKYRVTAKVYKGAAGTLPERLPSYGGQPPFRNTKATSLNNLVYTRTSKNRLPIKKVMAISIPQMPLNKSEGDVQREIGIYFEKEMEHRLMALMRVGK